MNLEWNQHLHQVEYMWFSGSFLFFPITRIKKASTFRYIFFDHFVGRALHFAAATSQVGALRVLINSKADLRVRVNGCLVGHLGGGGKLMG